MGIKKKFIGVGLLAILPFVLTACGSYSIQKTNFSITANGRINLNQYSYTDQHMFLGFEDELPVGTIQIHPANSKGKAEIKLSSIYEGGNYNASGSYSDGEVKFNFKGVGSNLVGVALCSTIGPAGSQCGTFPIGGFFSGSLSTNSNKVSSSSHKASELVKLKGGDCEQFLSFYESTNSAMPGTGIVVIRVCDAPNSKSMGPVGNYTGNDYVTVWIPGEMGTNDLNPYGNYISGGTMAGEENSANISISFPGTEPPVPTTPAPYPSPIAAG